MQRRRLLQIGFAGAAVLAVTGGSLALLQPATPAGKLSPGAHSVFQAVGDAILDGSLPPQGGERRIALQGMMDRIERLIAGLPPHAQGELGQLLAILASAPGRIGLAGLRTDWQTASIAQVQASLDGMRRSGLALRRQAYQALHDITGSAYFSDEGTWGQLGYPGPVSI